MKGSSHGRHQNGKAQQWEYEHHSSGISCQQILDRMRQNEMERRSNGNMNTISVGYLRRTPHPAIVAIRDNKDSIRVLFYSYYTTITGWGGPPKGYPFNRSMMDHPSRARGRPFKNQ